jgi:hypothetical protein
MRITPARHDRTRTGHRAGAVLAVLLAALVHLLCCAHGPASAATGRADTLAVVTAAAPCGPPAGPHGHAPRSAEGGEGHDDAECRGADEPGVQAPRGLQPASDAAVPHHTGGADPGALPAALAAPPRHAAHSRPPLPAPTGQGRARLGVWRT